MRGRCTLLLVVALTAVTTSALAAATGPLLALRLARDRKPSTTAHVGEFGLAAGDLAHDAEATEGGTSDAATWLIDLHTHTTTSDGADSPRALIQKAYDQGVQVLAITDHDQLSYDEEAIAYGVSLGMKIIRGIELSCEWSFYFSPEVSVEGKSALKKLTQAKVHLLGYFTHQTPASPLGTLLVDLQEKRRQRNALILTKLKDKFDIEITPQQVIEAGSRELAASRNAAAAVGSDSGNTLAAVTTPSPSLEYFGRPHIGHALIAAGHVKTMGEAFARYLSDDQLQLEPWSLDFAVAINAIAEHGGVAVLAHPVTLGLPLPALETELTHLLSTGGAPLRGLEVYSSKHSAEESKELLAMARRLGLVPTGGSDYHGSNKDGVPLAQFGRPDSAVDSTRKWGRINRRSLARLVDLRRAGLDGESADIASLKATNVLLFPPLEQSAHLSGATSGLIQLGLWMLMVGLVLILVKLGGRRCLTLIQGSLTSAHDKK